MKQPTIYGYLEDNRVAEIEEAASEFRSRVAHAVQESSVGFIEQSLREAYRRGVVDGFAQGVAACDVEAQGSGQ